MGSSNKYFRLKIFVALTLAFLSLSSFAQVKKFDRWDSAQADALQRKTSILIILTGEEWCKPCIKMKKEVFDHELFISFAKEKLTLFEINLPAPLVINSKVYKDYLFYQEKYQTNALPSLILTDQSGKEITRVTQRTSSLNYVMDRLKRR